MKQKNFHISFDNYKEKKKNDEIIYFSSKLYKIKTW